MIKLNLPNIHGNSFASQDDAERLKSYLYQLTDQLQYLLGSIDLENLAPDVLTRLNETESLAKSIAEGNEKSNLIRRDLQDYQEQQKDFVVEQGEINEWTYRKWNSGIAECWKTIVCENVNCNTAWGSVYEDPHAFGNKTFPFAFVGKPNLDLCISRTTDSAYFLTTPYGAATSCTSENTGTWYFWRPAATKNVATVYVDAYAIGKWK